MTKKVLCISLVLMSILIMVSRLYSSTLAERSRLELLKQQN